MSDPSNRPATTEENRPYVRPLGLLAGNAARHAVEAGLALPLAGGPLAFTMVEILVRDRAACLLPLSDWRRHASFDRCAGPLTAARAPIAGFDLTRPVIMGIVNVTPDSFSDGGRYFDHDTALHHARALKAAGADIIDVGGESTRPGAAELDVAEEGRRVLPIIAKLAQENAGPLSIDSRKAQVVEAALQAGALIVNDVSALTFDAATVEVVRRRRAPVVLMHAQGTPDVMQANPVYDDVLLDLYDYFEDRLAQLEAQGLDRARIIVDPGIGFGKTLEHNLRILDGAALFHGLGVPVMIGASRKSFIGKIMPRAGTDDRLPGSLAALLAAVGRGVQFCRVHDVAETVQAARVWWAVAQGIGVD